MFFYFSIIFYILPQGLYEKMVKVNVVEDQIISYFRPRNFFWITLRLGSYSVFKV